MKKKTKQNKITTPPNSHKKKDVSKGKLKQIQLHKFKQNIQ